MNIIITSSFDELINKVKYYKENDYFFIGEFLQEIDQNNDKLIIVLDNKKEQVIIENISKNTEKLPKISDIYYGAYNFENEIYDFYGREIEGDKAHILRLHHDKKNYFPKRKLGKSNIKEKREYYFTQTEGEGNVKVQVGPIHAGIIPPGHFRFTCDGEDTLNLDIQLGWIHRGIEEYFIKEFDLYKLLNASEDIVGDSRIAYSLNFIKLIEKASNLEISDIEKQERIIALELERIYNHLWTIGAMLNDVGQGSLLNGFLSIREEFLDLFDKIYNSRTLKGVISFGKNNINLNNTKASLILKIISKIETRFNELYELGRDSAGIYDRFKETGIVHYTTAKEHSALGIGAKASRLYRDTREKDPYYKDIKIKKIVGEQGDVFDRYNVRVEEIIQSFEIIKNILNKKEFIKDNCKKIDIKLNDGIYTSFTEGQRGETFMFMEIKNGKINYFKIKDPSFMNWTLLEYAVLNNIIADFPICNKSFDLSYSGFDL